MSRYLFRLGRNSARHPFRVLGVWVLAAVAVVTLNGAVGGTTTDDFRVPGTESQRAVEVLRDRFPAQAGATGQVVFHSDGRSLTDDGLRRRIGSSVATLRALEGVVAASDPFDAANPTIGADGRTAFSSVTFVEETLNREMAEKVIGAVERMRSDELAVELSGTITEAAAENEGNEMIGLAIAVLVLLIAFGSVIAMGIPIGTALFGIFIGLTGVSVMAGLVDVPSVSPMLATMIGLGVGIDYALFVVTRHRQFLQEGWSVADAAGRANATAGQSVLFAGTTVVIAIGGLFLSGIPALGTMGLASGLVVAISMAAAVTLLPAFLGLAGTWIDRLHVGRRRTSVGSVEAHETMSGRWAHRVGRRPWPYALVSVVALLVLAAPVTALRVGFADDGNAPKQSTERKAYDLLTAAFGPGFNAPLTIVTETSAEAEAGPAAEAISERLRSEPGIAGVGTPMLSEAGTTAVVVAYPSTSPQAKETQALVHRLRDDVIPSVQAPGTLTFVTGWTAAGIDISERLMDRTPWFIAAVVVLSFLLLTVLFRSIVVPLKAALMNLLSIGASYGLLVAVFQWGWGKGLIGLEETVPIFPFVPMIMFAILFGLSMDYEVFLLSRVREEYLRTGDSHRSVVDGLASTARVITSAALIMISVFGAFVFSPDVELKMFGLGLAVAVLIDATVVRMVLVPATMALLGSANWWLPSWLDRLLPHVDVEGAGLDTAPTPTPALEPVAA